ncbi:MAG: hypothetical protein LBP40_01010 [Campylobacteraceae bacterium]|jgi:hypothetical protein|nr:hypothetical protein [Campylobacteraceae bacterium]
MNKINPLILLSILTIILIAAMYNVSRLKSEITQQNSALFALQNSAERAAFSKKIWSRTNLKERLNAIFTLGNINDKGKTFEVKASSLTRTQVNDMVKKTLGDGFELEKLVIFTEAEDKISLTVEIAK